MVTIMRTWNKTHCENRWTPSAQTGAGRSSPIM
jgi:hypothetical protein